MPVQRTIKKREPYPCALCDKSYKDSAGLNRHLHEHDDTYWWPCEWAGCDRRFKQHYALVIHDNVHTGKKPYECPLCDKRFGDPSSLSRHLGTKQHRDAGVILPHRCPLPQCSRHMGFERKEQMKKHMLSEHGMKYDDSTTFARPRRALKAQAMEKAAKMRKQAASGSKAPRTTRSSKHKEDEYEAPRSLEYQSVIKPEPQEIAPQHLDNFGIPHIVHRYAQDLSPSSVPHPHAAFNGRNTATPYMSTLQPSHLAPPQPTYPQHASLAPWDDTRRHVWSPVGSSARSSPLMSPNLRAMHSLAPSPVSRPHHIQEYNLAPAYEKASYNAATPAPEMWLGGYQYHGALHDSYHNDQFGAPAPVHDMLDMNAYINCGYSA